MAGFLSILMYHQVGRFAPMKTHRANYCDRDRFARQMAFLHHGGFRVLDLEAALAALAGKQPIPPKAVVLSFDDGYAAFIQEALPVLRRYGFPAVLYAISQYLGKRADWFAKEPNRPVPRLLSGAQLREIRQAGIRIGSHSAHHVRLGEVDDRTKWRELADSKAALEDLLGEAVPHLCYPFGSFDQTVLQMAQEIGYRSALTCLRGAATREDHPLALPRKAISFGDNLIGYAWKLLVKQAPTPALLDWRRRLG